MPLTVAVQMDPIEHIRIAGDTTFALMLEAQRRGHALVYWTPERLSMRDGRVVARVRDVSVQDVEGAHATLGEPRRIAVEEEVDVVLMRQDPPFDLAYITASHLLERVHPKVLVVNDPMHVRNAPEKIFVTEFPHLMPPTLISRDKEEIQDFRREHGAVVMKPLHGHGGAAVVRLMPDDPNFGSLFDLFSVTFREPWVIQKFLPRITEGDKRILLVDGEARGAINRVPAAGDIRSNMVRGGGAVATSLTDKEREICEALRPHLKRMGLILVGIDVIDGLLTEINVTSPTGVRAVKALGGPDVAVDVWDAIEAKRA
ncbi:glutathione synthase [Salinarimonas rosea]|uniref:glutathione synthase n=1 Tax=Salinarimonas rosea TaxID=552063 RepID=UPI000407243A|nr:glutathione synthase [Salinarimonas rosea]